jgi:hypothetical protein
MASHTTTAPTVTTTAGPEIEPEAHRRVFVPVTAEKATGTLELTAEDAQAIGVRPGYTPGALIVPGK